MAVEIFQVDRFGAGFQRHAQTVAGVLLGAAQFAAVGVGADVFLDEFFVGGESAGGKNCRAGAQFDGLAVAFADQADDSVIFNDQADAFYAIEITAAEIEKLLFETRDGARADIFFVDRSKEISLF